MGSSFGRRRFISMLGAIGASAFPFISRAETSPSVVYLRPLGPALPSEESDILGRSLTAVYAVDVRWLSRVPLPSAAFYAPRRRHRAERLLTVLERTLPADGDRIIGVTTRDISTTKGKVADWGVLGLANMSGSACVLSSFRCYRTARNARHARERFGKVAIHELGHTLGLPHCTASGSCLMRDAGGAAATLDHEHDVCGSCRAKLLARGHGVRAGRLPWEPAG